MKVTIGSEVYVNKRNGQLLVLEMKRLRLYRSGKHPRGPVTQSGGSWVETVQVELPLYNWSTETDSVDGSWPVLAIKV